MPHITYLTSKLWNDAESTFTCMWPYGDCGDFCFLKKMFLKSSYICFFIQKPVTSIIQEWLTVKCCLIPQWIAFLMFCRLVYNIHLFKWLDIDLKCIVTITPKGQSLKFKASVWNIPISETGRNCNSLFNLVDVNWVVIMEQKRNME